MSEQDVFATLPAGRSLWAVAAIHGEVDRLRGLHARLADRIEVGEPLIYLGNFMGWGSAVFETVQELLLFRRTLLARPGADCADLVYLRGCQEEMWQRLLQLQFAVNPTEVLRWMLDHGVGTTLAAYGGRAKDGIEATRRGAVAVTEWTSHLRATLRGHDGHNALLRSLRRAAFSGDGTVLLVSAGIDITRPPSEQLDSFWWGGTPFETIRAPFHGVRRIVRGFDPKHGGIDVHDIAITIDGGCGFGGPLVAARFDSAGAFLDRIEE
jgi:serine/threonine protein phosphatase 1